MSNIINFADLIGAEETVHEYELNGRTILYSDPALESIPALNKMFAGEWSFSHIYKTAVKALKGQTFKDGEYSEEWLESVPYGDFLHFAAFIRNPDAPGEKLPVSEPAIVRGFRGHDIKLPPVTLGNVRFFGEYLENNRKASVAEYLLEQLDKAFADATLEDGSPLPEGLTDGLRQNEAQALIRFWISREGGEQKNVEEPTVTGKKSKRARGSKQSASSSTPTDSQSSEATQTTLESSS